MTGNLKDLLDKPFEDMSEEELENLLSELKTVKIPRTNRSSKKKPKSALFTEAIKESKGIT